MKNKIRLLNSKSIFDCIDDDEVIKHFEEMNEIFNRILNVSDYNVALLCKYQDEYHKNEPMKIIGSKISEALNEVELFDVKNGVDLCMDENNYLVLIIYGRSYNYLGIDYMVEMAVKVLPYNEKKEFLDVSEVLDNGEVKVSKYQFCFNDKYN